MATEQKEMRMNFVKILIIAGSVFAATHCGNVGIYDEATATYYRVVRSGLNEWYPLNGNLSSKIGSAAGTATGAYSAGTNRAGESGKAICMTSTPNIEWDFSTAPSISPPFTLAMWVKINQIPAISKILLQKGAAGTSYNGFKIEVVNPSGALQATFSNNIAGNAVLTGPSATLGAWYYIAFSYGNGVGSFYTGQYGSTFVNVGATANVFGLNTPVKAFSNLTNTVDGCADDLVHYNRVLSFDEVKQNFLSVE